MNHEITPNVVNDLWPLCQSGDASADSRALVDAYLAHDPEFATQLKEVAKMEHALPKVMLSPDTERRLLEEARSKARIQLMLVGGGLGLAFLALIGVMFKLL
jgi:ferric-dicitrate binding protein FerR (iron transport regulator)